MNITKSAIAAVITAAFISGARADIECPAWQQLDISEGLVQPMGALAVTDAGLERLLGGVEGCRVQIRATGIPQATRSYVASKVKLDAANVRFLIAVNGLTSIEPQRPDLGGHSFTIAKIEFTKRVDGVRAADLFVSSYSTPSGEKRVRVHLRQANGAWLSTPVDVAASGLGQVFEVRWERNPSCFYGGNYDCTSTVSIYPSSGGSPSSTPLFQYEFPRPISYPNTYNFGIVPSRIVAGSQFEDNLKFTEGRTVPSLLLDYLVCYNNSEPCILSQNVDQN